MKRFFAFLLLISAPLMAQHATQFAYYTTTTCQVIFPLPPPQAPSPGTDSPESGPTNPYTAIAWDPDTQISTEGISLESNYESKVTLCNQLVGSGLEFPNTIHIHHAGWYLAKFLITANADKFPGDFRFGLLNLDDLTIIPFSVYGVQAHDNFLEQLAGQVVFYAPANTRIQLVNDGIEEVILQGIEPSPIDTTFLTSIYLVELLGR